MMGLVAKWRCISFIPWACLALLASVTVPLAAYGQRSDGDGTPDVLRGRILTADSAHTPIGGAHVSVTGLQSHIVRTTTTDAQGVYTLLFATGEGTYRIVVKAIGFFPSARRIVRPGSENMLVTDFSILPVIAKLSAIAVTSDTHSLDSLPTDDVSVDGHHYDVRDHQRFSPDSSDVTTLLQGVPGVVLLPGKGYSVDGAAPDQNSTLLNGSTINGLRLPRDAIGPVGFASTTYDASRGGFAGGQVSITSQTGTNVSHQLFRSTIKNSRWAWIDPANPVPPSATQAWSGTVNGPIKQNEAFYLVAFEVDRTTSPLPSLLHLSDAAIAQNGIVPDTVRAVGQALNELEVPLTTSAIPQTQANVSEALSLNLTATPTAKMTFGLNLIGNWAHQAGTEISPLTYPDVGREARQAAGALQGSATVSVGNWLEEFHGALNVAHSLTNPYLNLPGATVQVTSISPTGQTGAATLGFGGSTAGSASELDQTLDLTNATSWLSVDSRHQVKLAESMNVSRATTRSLVGQFGAYTYQSLADLAANTPASYTRTVTPLASAANTLTHSSISLGDLFHVSKLWQLEYGIRADLASTQTKPTYNPVVEQLFGERTDQVPHMLSVSPRVGFSWTQWAGSDIPAWAQQAKIAGHPDPTPLTVSGGIGAFRGVIDPAQIAQLANATGLPNTTHQLSCVGPATPVPVWSHFGTDAAAIPAQCLDGSAAVDATDLPSVQMYAPDFRAPLSWRGNLALGGLQRHGWGISLGTEYSVGKNGQDSIDLNRPNVPLFTLAGEGGRPMYVPPNAIDSTGAIAANVGRLVNQFGSVMSTQSDLESVTHLVTVKASPLRPLFGKMPLTVSYTVASDRTQFRDLTSADPDTRLWTNGVLPRHQVVVSSALPVWRVTLTVQATLTSGMPYTPLIASDVNGDGVADDRAFIANPAHTTDTLLADQMTTLLRSADPHVRDCLNRQLGRIAGYNSCSTNWQLLIQPNVAMDLHLPSPSKSLAADRIHLSLVTQNTMSAVLRLLHLSNVPVLRTIGDTPSTSMDPTLLYVRGYDPVAQRFLYQVNQQFGETRLVNGRPVQPPFQVYVTGELHLGGTEHPARL